MKNEMIIHYDISDLAYSYYFDMLIKKLNEDIKHSDLSVIDILEYIEIILFGDDQNNKNLKEEYRDYLKTNEKIKEIRKVVALYFNSFNSPKLLAFIKDISSGGYNTISHQHSFIQYFVNSDLYKKMLPEDLEIIFDSSYLTIDELCFYKKFVNYFSTFLHDYILKKPELIRIVTNKYDSFNKYETRTLYLPAFDDEEINGLISKYLESDSATNNVLMKLMYHVNNKNSYSISKENKQKIKELYKKKQTELYNKTNAVRFGIQITINDNQKQVLTNKFENGLYKIGLSKRVLDNIKTSKQAFIFVASLLLLDNNHLINGIYFKNAYESVFDDLVESYSQRYGNDSYSFVESINIGLFSVIYEYLSSKGQHLELCVNELFDEINKKVKNAHYSINLQTLSEPYYKTSENLFNEMQSLLRQHNTFVNFNSMELKDIEVDDSDARFDKIVSLFKPKYLELCDNQDLRKILFYLFSPTAFPVVLSGTKRRCTHFAQLIDENHINYTFYVSRYPDIKPKLDFLIDNSIIVVDNDYIEFVNPLTIKLLEIIQKNEALPYFILNDESKIIADEFVDRGYLRKSDLLFSIAETNYLSYVFDSKKYSNALSLRNKYEHGYGKHFDEKKAKHDYLLGLMVTMSIVAKIYDEFVQFGFGGKNNG